MKQQVAQVESVLGGSREGVGVARPAVNRASSVAADSSLATVGAATVGAGGLQVTEIPTPYTLHPETELSPRYLSPKT